MRGINGSEEKLTMCESPGVPRQEWRLLVKGKRDMSKVSKERIKRSIIEGIPERYRGQIWCLLCEISSSPD